MSLDYMEAVGSNPHFSLSQNAVMVYLAWNADEEGVHSASIPEIHRWTGARENTVRKAIHEMTDGQCLTLERKPGKPIGFRLSLEGIKAWTPGGNAPPAEAQGVAETTAATPCGTDRGTPCESATPGGTARGLSIGERASDPLPPPSPPEEDLTKKKIKNKNPSVEANRPDWMLPLIALEGFREQKSWSRFIEVVEVACTQRNVEPVVVAREFATYWPIGKAQHGWISPTKALMKTITVQVAKAASHNGREPPKVQQGKTRLQMIIQDKLEHQQRLGNPNPLTDRERAILSGERSE